MNKLTHTDDSGKAVMIDIGSKDIQLRIARATGNILMTRETIKLVRENMIKKGDVLTVAQIAGINAAKQTSALIPLCHNIVLDQVAVDLTVTETGITAVSEIRCTGKTGVEMEALTAVTVTLLTVYDMCKAVDKEMIIGNVNLTEKLKK
jgi:cyclic pyranopterin phosphate synthase